MHNFLTNNFRRGSFTPAHAEHLVATYNLISDTVVSGASAASTDANPASQISTQTSLAASADESYSNYAGQPGFKSSGKLLIGGLEKFIAEGRFIVRWRRRFADGPVLYTPRRDTVDEAIQDYLYRFRAQEGLDDTAAQMDAMRAAARELHSRDIGGIEQTQHGTYRFRIRGKLITAGPKRPTLA